MDIYSLSRKWFDFCFINPEKIRPNHTALYFFCIEHCNRLGWKEKFGLPTTMAKEAIGIRSYNTYIETLHDLINWGFIIMVEVSKNQYSSNIIALSNFDKAEVEAKPSALSNFDKAMIKHVTKQGEITGQSISSIDIHNTSLHNYIINGCPVEIWDEFTKQQKKEYCTSVWEELMAADMWAADYCRMKKYDVNDFKSKLKEFIIDCGSDESISRGLKALKSHFQNKYKVVLKNE
jgi:hypothetical protein